MIEHHLRRDILAAHAQRIRAEKRRRALLVVLVMVLAIAADAFLVIHMPAQAASEPEQQVIVGHRMLVLNEFCRQAIADHKASGEKIEGDLAKVCL